MTYNNKKTIPIVFAFAALLMAMPLAQTAFAVGSTSSLNLECGVTTPTTIDFGSFSLDTPPAQFTDADMTKLGGEIGSFDVVATDWLGVAQRSSGAILVVGPSLTDAVTVNGLLYTVAGTDTANTFQLGATDAATAISLATAINLNAETGLDEATHDVDATAVGTTVILRSDVADADGDNIGVIQTVGTGTLVPSAATLLNGEDAGVIHMLASNTKFTVTVDGSSSSGDNYGAKTALAATGVDLSLASQTQATTNLQMSLEINPITANMLNLPYNGDLTQTLTFTSLCNQT